jgi:cysteine sulfinate desulfinase/cysteine desulfurase-like protein
MASASIRISFSHSNTVKQVDQFVTALADSLQLVKKLSGEKPSR